MILIVVLMIIVVLLFLFFPQYINIIFKRKVENNVLIVQIKLFMGLFKISHEVPYLDIIEKNQGLSTMFEVKNRKITDFIKIKKVFGRYNFFNDLMKETLTYMLKSVRIITLKCSVRMGLVDSAITGFLYGVLWTLISILLTPFIKHSQIDEVSINILPLFNENELEIDIFCIIKFKIVHIIIAGFKGLKECIKGGVNNVRTSNPRTNEDNNG